MRDDVISLRRAGASGRQIRDSLGIGGSTLAKAVEGVPPPAWTRRPRAKPELRARARELRAQGKAYNEIAAELGVSKSSVSVWVRDMQPIESQEIRRRKAAAAYRYWEIERHRRETRRDEEVRSAATAFGAVSSRSLVIAGAVAYWCEGSKNKSGQGAGRVSFVNSDPGLIRLFLRFLHDAGIGPERLTFRVMIHESSDVAAAERFWQDATGADHSRFHKPTIKAANAVTNRKNIGDSYHGCLAISALGSADLYDKIEGCIRGIKATLGESRGTVTGFSATQPPVSGDGGKTVSSRTTPGALQLRQRAVALRLAGKSRREIRHILRIRSNETLNDALRGVPPPSWLAGGGSGPAYAENRRAAAAGVDRYWQQERQRREAGREASRAAAAARIGELSIGEILAAGAVAYWCEGTKSKSYRRSEEVIFVNSDPGLIAFFLHFLAKIGIDSGRLVFRVLIHQSADVAAAEQFWLGVTGASTGQFRRATLKRHEPRTARRHAGSGYRGCLTVYVKHGASLYRTIEGIMRAVTESCQTPSGNWVLQSSSAPGGGFEPPSQQDQNLASCLIRPSGNGETSARLSARVTP